ncbi:MAG: gliding motility-associated C-terminal domain-containing protein [Saprospiraceae bacterium]|nr:gliding motility-associated C-terminal domain-containing protein [Saprospiraceae bacterium]
MIKFFGIFLLVMGWSASLVAQPDNDFCLDAIRISDVTKYCSPIGAYTNAGAIFDPDNGDIAKATCWASASNDVWFKFVAIASDVLITINGTTLKRPELSIYTGDCRNMSEIFPCVTSPVNLNTATLYKGGLVIGATYYIRVDGVDQNVGTFQLCINNYNPPASANGDCATATVLCSKDPFHVESVVGAGRDNDEADNSCLDFNNSDPRNNNSESNSTWYRWTALNDGPLTFKITPDDANDDIDFAVFEYPNGLSNCNNKKLVRCMATACLGPTGLNATSRDLEESPNCDPGEDGFVRQLDMVKGMSYGVMINNFTSSNHGFFIEFGGLGDFLGPETKIEVAPETGLKCEQAFTIRDSTFFAAGQIVKYTWNFGDGATPSEVAFTKGPHQVRYKSFGAKTIVLVVESDKGCTYSFTRTINVEPCCEDLPTLKAVPDAKDLTCNGIPSGSISIGGSGGTPEYLYALGNGKFKRQFKYTNLDKGTYQVKVTDARGCRDSTNVSLAEPPPIIVDAGPDLTGRLGYEVRLNGSYNPTNATNVTAWVPPDGIVCPTCLSTDAIPPGSTQYKLVVTTADGCVAADSMFVDVTLDRAIYIPNTFTPDRDTRNKIFKLFGNRAIESIEYLRVFNRWGGLVYEGNNLDINDDSSGWDGTANGQALPSGVYAYSASVLFVDKVTRIIKGDVTLLR